MRKYDTYGLPLAVQIWAYEAVPLLGTQFAKRGETRCYRMHHWRAFLADGCPTSKKLSALLDDLQIRVITQLMQSMEEDGRGYVRELAAPHDEAARDEGQSNCFTAVGVEGFTVVATTEGITAPGAEDFTVATAEGFIAAAIAEGFTSEGFTAPTALSSNVVNDA